MGERNRWSPSRVLLLLLCKFDTHENLLIVLHLLQQTSLMHSNIVVVSHSTILPHINTTLSNPPLNCANITAQYPPLSSKRPSYPPSTSLCLLLLALSSSQPVIPNTTQNGTIPNQTRTKNQGEVVTGLFEPRGVVFALAGSSGLLDFFHLHYLWSCREKEGWLVSCLKSEKSQNDRPADGRTEPQAGECRRHCHQQSPIYPPRTKAIIAPIEPSLASSKRSSIASSPDGLQRERRRRAFPADGTERCQRTTHPPPIITGCTRIFNSHPKDARHCSPAHTRRSSLQRPTGTTMFVSPPPLLVHTIVTSTNSPYQDNSPSNSQDPSSADGWGRRCGLLGGLRGRTWLLCFVVFVGGGRKGGPLLNCPIIIP